MSADELVARLDLCRPNGEGKWMARCPAHDDKSPSLSITERSDGRVLIHCHAGCGANDILDSVGLDYSALFPEQDNHYMPLAKGWQQMRREGPSVPAIMVEIAQEPTTKLSGGDREAMKRLLLAGVQPSNIRKGIKAEAEKGQAQIEKTLHKLRNNLPLDVKDHTCCRFAFPDVGPIERELRRLYIARIQEDKYTLVDAMDDIEWALCNQIELHDVDREILAIAKMVGA